MVKPALAYLDVIRRVRDAVDVPVAAYNISGEYAMVEAAAARGWIDREAAILETLTAIRRAGSDIVLTYWAAEAARLFALRRSGRPGGSGSRQSPARLPQPPGWWVLLIEQGRWARRCRWLRGAARPVSKPPDLGSSLGVVVEAGLPGLGVEDRHGRRGCTG